MNSIFINFSFGRSEEIDWKPFDLFQNLVKIWYQARESGGKWGRVSGFCFHRTSFSCVEWNAGFWRILMFFPRLTGFPHGILAWWADFRPSYVNLLWASSCKLAMSEAQRALGQDCQCPSRHSSLLCEHLCWAQNSAVTSGHIVLHRCPDGFLYGCRRGFFEDLVQIDIAACWVGYAMQLLLDAFCEHVYFPSGMTHSISSPPKWQWCIDVMFCASFLSVVLYKCLWYFSVEGDHDTSCACMYEIG